MKFIKLSIFSLILSIIFISNIYASSNKYTTNEKIKELEIIEEYINNYNVNDIEVKILKKLLDQVEVKVKTTLETKSGFFVENNTLQKINNIKKTNNEEYNIKEFYIIGTSKIKNNLNAYWYKIIEDGNIKGKGFVKEDDTFLIKREFGTGNEINEQTEPIYTTNKIINTIQNSELLKINDLNINKKNNNSYQLSFSILIDKLKLPEIRYLYIGHNENIIEKENETIYISAISDEIDLNLYESSYFENSEIVKNPIKLGSSNTEPIEIEKTPKIDIVIHNADEMNTMEDIENILEVALNNLKIAATDILYYIKNVKNFIFGDYLSDNKIDAELKNYGVATPSQIVEFSNTTYKEEELTYLSLEDFEPDNIEHTCSFVSTSNEKYHWEFCSLCGESAELLETINNNTISKPTDNDDETKGNRNIKEHNYENNRIVSHTVYNYCNNCIIYGYCSCGKYGVYGTTYNTGYGRLGSCRGCNYEHTMGTTLTTITYHGSTARYHRCTRCGCPSEAINPSCESSKRHNMYIPTEVNQISVCLCKQCSFKCLKYEYTIDKINKKIIVNTQYETNRNDATFNNTTAYGEEDDDPAKYSYPTNVNVSNSLVSSSGKYIYNYTFNISFNESTPLNSSMNFLRELNTSNGFMISIITSFNVTEFISPTIISVASTSMAAHDENGKSWITQKQYIFTGTENSHFVALKIVDLFGNIYFDNSCQIKEGNNWSINFTPNIEANVKKTLKATAYDKSGNESEPYYFDIDTTDCKAPTIISNLDYRDNWKNKIIYKAEAYEGGIGLTQIALNKNSDFKFVDKIENPDKSGNDIYYRYYVFQGDVYGDDVITPTLFARDGLNHLDSKKILIAKLDSTKPTIEEIKVNNNQIEIIANDKHMTKGEGSGIKAFSVVPIGKNPTLSSFKFTENIIQIDYNGEYDVFAIDNAGNISNNYTIYITNNDEYNFKLRDDAIKIYLYIDNKENDIFKENDFLIKNLKDFDGTYIWLTNECKSFYNEFLNKLDNSVSLNEYTHYKDNEKTYTTAVSDTADFIKKLIGFVEVRDYVPPNKQTSRNKKSSNGGEIWSQAYLDSLNKKNEINEDLDLSNYNQNYVKSKNHKDIIELLTEIYTDFKENNNIGEKKKLDLIDIIKNIYQDFNNDKKTNIENNDNQNIKIFGFNNTTKNTVMALTNTFTNEKINNTTVASKSLATESVIKKINAENKEFLREIKINNNEEIKNNVPTGIKGILMFLFNRKEYNKLKELNKEIEIKASNNEVLKIKDKDTEPIIATKSITNIIIDKNYNENIDYVDKVFKNYKDKLEINDLAKELNNRNFEIIYENFYSGKYEDLINNFIEEYRDISIDIKKEVSKKKYKQFIENIEKDFKDNKFDKIKNELNDIINKYKNETKEIIKLFNNYDYKNLCINLNKGKYIDLIDECKEIIFRNEYNNIREDFINEFSEGKYTEIMYDFIYNILEITYNYNKKIENKQKIKVTTTSIPEKEVKNIENGKEINILPIVLFVVIIIIIVLLIILKNKKFNKKGENYYE